MKECSLCKTQMILRQHHTPITGNVTGGTVSLSDGSIDVNAVNIATFYYCECPKCGNIEIVESGFSLPQKK